MNIAIAQSGGPTCAINASLLGVFRQAYRDGRVDAIFGSINGIEGMINDNLINLKSVIRTNIDMELLRQTPSTVLGSCRYKLPDYHDDSAVYEKIEAVFEKHMIDVFVYIGGNDSMDTVVKLSAYFKEKGKPYRVMGVPKTIDNDLPITDHTPGFGSAAKYVCTTVQEIIRDSSVYSIDSVTVIEIMGRHAGWLTASTCILHTIGQEAPHLIYLPEAGVTVEQILEDVKRERAKHQAVIIAVSEGIDVSDLAESAGVSTAGVDAFGHKFQNGVGKVLERIIAQEFGCKVRSIELNVMQRCSSHICSKTDIDEAEEIGAAGLEAALAGNTGKMMYFKRISNQPYLMRIEMVDATECANIEKKFPHEWINAAKNNVTDEAVAYFMPLIQGDIKLITRNGLPLHFNRSTFGVFNSL
ncbi:MAG: diphosphate--fructose-6-phosphate 1-phosphotransferase [Lachnospiraceae bacterium]|nr:diphosphate--fructose-6-phosphate 1-phosphotransferase [Lachnospiraceae bacterium]